MIEIPHSRIRLARLPTPLERLDRLSEAWGGPTIWVKRDDLTGFGLSGNKVRKLEYHLAAARLAGATHVVTCGAVQSNHCRATALAAARLGFACTLLLRSTEGEQPALTGNHLLARLAGASIEVVTPDEYERRDDHMRAIAAAHGAMWVIPEGASDELGMWAFAAAADEFIDQWDDLGVDAEPIIWHAASSGSTTAGLALGTALRHRPWRIVASSVGEKVAGLAARIDRVRDGSATAWNEPELIDDYIGEGYGRATPDELAVQADATARTGLIWDPTYTGKALAALESHVRTGLFSESDHVVFWHTGGGFATFAHDWSMVS